MVCRIPNNHHQHHHHHHSASPFSLSIYPIQNALKSTSYFLHTLFLFTAADFCTFALPTTLFGLFAALSGPLLLTTATSTNNDDDNTFSNSSLPILSRIPATLALIWINLLIFDISNQRSPSAIEEDRVNKPTRPIPSGRISSETARELCLALVPVALVASWFARVEYETLLLFTFQWMYNDLAGCDAHFVLRNSLIAIGYGLYSAIALWVMAGAEARLSAKGVQWVALVGMVMLVTQHICDIKDVQGDRVRGRKSAPIVLGDEACRWSVAVSVMICSLVCPAFFALGMWSYAFTMSLGGLVAIRTMTCRTVQADKLTWKLWAFWTVSLFTLPLVSHPEAVYVAWRSVSEFVCPNQTCFDGFNITAASIVALAVTGRRVVSYMSSGKAHVLVPTITVEGVVA